MKQITIYELIPLLRKGWVAMDEDGTWAWYQRKPYMTYNSQCEGEWFSKSGSFLLPYCFNIKSERYWEESLIRVGGKTKKRKSCFWMI